MWGDCLRTAFALDGGGSVFDFTFNWNNSASFPEAFVSSSSLPSSPRVHFCVTALLHTFILSRTSLLPLSCSPGKTGGLVLLQIQKHGFEPARPPPADVSAAPPTPSWKVTWKKGDFWYFPTKSFFASAGLRLGCCYGDAAAGGTAVTPPMHPDLLIGRMERPRCAPPGRRRSRHGRRRLAFRLSEVTDSPHLPSRHVAFSKQQERGGGVGVGPWGSENIKYL